MCDFLKVGKGCWLCDFFGEGLPKAGFLFFIMLPTCTRRIVGLRTSVHLILAPPPEGEKFPVIALD